MAGMVPKRRSRGEIERANEELLSKNCSYMQRWLDRHSEVAEPSSGLDSTTSVDSVESIPVVDFR
jgi:hypothetical protein